MFHQGLTDRGISYVLVVKAATTAHLATAVPEPPKYNGGGPHGLPRYRETSLSLKALAAGRKELHHLTWRHGSRTGPRSATAAMKSRFLAIRIRLANRDIPLNGDRSLPDAWMLAQ